MPENIAFTTVFYWVLTRNAWLALACVAIRCLTGECNRILRFFTLIALIACLLLAWRALRVVPLVALKAE